VSSAIEHVGSHANRRSPSSLLSHSPVRFQLAKIWLTSLRSRSPAKAAAPERRQARRRASFSRASARPAKTSASLRSPSPAKAAKTATRHPVGRSSFCRRPVHRSIVYARSRQSAILHCHQHDNRQGQRLRAEDHQAVHRDARHATAGAGANQTRRLSVCTWRRARRPGSRSPCITC
jgi:hypothetical protein